MDKNLDMDTNNKPVYQVANHHLVIVVLHQPNDDASVGIEEEKLEKNVKHFFVLSSATVRVIMNFEERSTTLTYL